MAKLYIKQLRETINNMAEKGEGLPKEERIDPRYEQAKDGKPVDYDHNDPNEPWNRINAALKSGELPRRKTRQPIPTTGHKPISRPTVRDRILEYINPRRS